MTPPSSIRRRHDTALAWRFDSGIYAIFRASVISILIHGLLFWFVDTLSTYKAAPGKVYPRGDVSQLEVGFRAPESPRALESFAASPKIAESNSQAVISETNTLSSASSPVHAVTQRRTPAAIRAEQGETAFSPPEFTVGIEPRYPLLQFSKGIRGAVTATFQIDRVGEIGEIEIMASHPLGAFDEAVIQAIMAAKLRVNKPFPRGRLSITVIFDPAGTNTQTQITQQQ